LLTVALAITCICARYIVCCSPAGRCGCFRCGSAAPTLRTRCCGPAVIPPEKRKPGARGVGAVLAYPLWEVVATHLLVLAFIAVVVYVAVALRCMQLLVCAGCCSY